MIHRRARAAGMLCGSVRADLGCFRLACVASKSSPSSAGGVPVLDSLHAPHPEPPRPGKEREHTAGTPQFQGCGQALGLSHLAFCPGGWVTGRLLICHSTAWKYKAWISFNSLVTTWKAELQALVLLWQR